MSDYSLTHICQMDPSIIINMTSPFPNLGVSGAFFYFNFIFNRICKPWSDAAELSFVMIRRRVLRRLIWVGTACLGPKKGREAYMG